MELSIVKKEYCRKFLYPTPFELHVSNAHLHWFIDNPTDYIHKMNGTDKDLAAHFKIIKEYGVVLQGEEKMMYLLMCQEKSTLIAFGMMLRDLRKIIGRTYLCNLEFMQSCSFPQKRFNSFQKAGRGMGITKP